MLWQGKAQRNAGCPPAYIDRLAGRRTGYGTYKLATENRVGQSKTCAPAKGAALANAARPGLRGPMTGPE